ncbi:MAG: peptide chain release factor aRF-1, partial [Nitrososphaerales archaeon]
MPTSSSVALYKVKRLLSELSEKKGRGTELISLYIPPKKALHEVIAALRDEYGTASNIKSDSTRNHVMDALVKTMQRLKLYKATPENGLVIFCGALPTNGPGSETIFLYEVFPPKPVQTYLYRCDDHFHLDILKDMLKEEKTIGLLSIDATEAAVGIIAGSRFEVVDEITSGVSGKHRAGGQSARRFERLREMELTEYYHRVARHVNKALLEEKTVQGLIVGGPGGT